MERPDDEVTPAEPDVSELKAEIAQTRDEMQGTIAEIQERLSPAHLAEQAKNTVREATIGRVTNMAERAGETASAVATQTRRAARRLPRPVRDNPLPLALIGAGVVWLLARTRSQATSWDDDYDDYEGGDYAGGAYGTDYTSDSRYSTYDESMPRGRRSRTSDRSRVSEVTSNVGEMASGAANRAREVGRDVASNVTEIASTAGRRARELGRDTQSRLSQTMNDNPLALGAVALIAGALIGMMLPRTQGGDSYLGETRDNVLDSAREMAEDKVQQLTDTVRESGEQPRTNPS